MDAERWQHFHDVMGDIGDSYIPNPDQRSELVRDVMEAAREILSPPPAPVDWPARLRAAADVARAEGWPSHGNLLLALAGWMTLNRAAVEATGRALLGEQP